MDRQSLIAGETGAAAVEFAITAPILVFMMIAVADYGGIVSDATKLNMAARAAAQYAVRYPSDASGIRAVGNAATNLTGSPVGAPSLYCTCGGSQPVPVSTDASTCPTKLAAEAAPACATGYTHV